MNISVTIIIVKNNRLAGARYRERKDLPDGFLQDCNTVSYYINSSSFLSSSYNNSNSFVEVFVKVPTVFSVLTFSFVRSPKDNIPPHHAFG